MGYSEGGSTAINIEIVTAILESAQEAWNLGFLEGVLAKYTDNIIYTTNTGGKSGALLTLRGKEALRRRLEGAMAVVDSQSRISSIRLQNGRVRTRLSVEMLHRETGISLTFTLRQVLRFEGFLIAEMQDFHDAAKLAAFWALVGDPLERKHKPESV